MKKALTLALIAVLLLAPAAPVQGAEADGFTAVATFYPVYLFAQNIARGVEGLTVLNLTPPTTGCLHDYQLTTEDMRRLAGADALLINGAGMEGWLDQVLGQYPRLPVIDCSAGISLLPSVHAEEGEYNPHIWLDPLNAALMGRNLAQGLSALLPGYRERLLTNADAWEGRMRTLDARVREGLSGLARRDIVTFHEAFPYFARAYDLRVVAVVALEPEEPLSPRMIADLVALIAREGNPPLFTEPQYQDAAVRTIALETGAPVYELDPLSTGDGTLTGYEEGTLRNLTTLIAALGG